MWQCGVVRQLESRLSVDGLQRALRPWALLRCGLEGVFKNLSYRPLPPFFDRARLIPPQRNRFEECLNEHLRFFPDRLGAGKWRGCCEVLGLERLQFFQRNRQAVALAFCHFGGYLLLRQWLRAFGVPAMTLIDGKAEERSALKTFADRLSPFPEVPTVLFRNQLRDAMRFLSAGHPLLIALDGNRGNQLEVPIDDEWVFRMATGPLRLAARQNAELLPCSIVSEGVWKFRIEIGEPVPQKFFVSESEWIEAGKHLLAHLLPRIQSHPAQCASKYFLRHFQRKPSILETVK